MNADVSELRNFAARLAACATGSFKAEIAECMDALGQKFLTYVQEEIIARNVVYMRRLLGSFYKGGKDNIFEIGDGGLSLEIGTNVEYAKYVEDGHAQEIGRFIPGVWNGDKFTFIKGAKDKGITTGMVLKAEWVPGKHYFMAAWWRWVYEKDELIKPHVLAWLRDMLGG